MDLVGSFSLSNAEGSKMNPKIDNFSEKRKPTVLDYTGGLERGSKFPWQICQLPKMRIEKTFFPPSPAPRSFTSRKYVTHFIWGKLYAS